MNPSINDSPAASLLQEQRNALANIAAVLARDAVEPPAEPDSVSYVSRGHTLVIGNARDVFAFADSLAAALPVTVLLTDADPAPAPHGYPVFAARAIGLTGWLGLFDAHWQAPGAAAGEGRFDLVLDLNTSPLISTHQKPNGYFAPGAELAARLEAVEALLQLVGEFDKPKYFVYKERLCAHSRNSQVGCHACLDVCSARAIVSAGDKVKVNPYLCAGCGACGTVCPSGALSFNYPSPAHTGRRIQAALRAYAEAGGDAPSLLFHSAGEGADLLGGAALPAHVIPLALHHTASTGIDVWLAALAYGAAGITVLMTQAEAPQYVAALDAQMRVAQTVMGALGFAGPHFQLARASNPHELALTLAAAPRGAAVPVAATFHLAAEKRNTLDYALAHLHRHAPQQPQAVALAAGAPFGAIAVNRATCSLCMACVGACPTSALMDSPNAPQLRFVEQNCIQCGLCASTCPENAITLVPRLSFDEGRRQAVLLNESQPFHCIKCNKPFGTLHMVENMLARLGSHPAFAGNPQRMRMCGDCRVIDMMAPDGEAAITALRRE